MNNTQKEVIKAYVESLDRSIECAADEVAALTTRLAHAQGRLAELEADRAAVLEGVSL